MNNKLLAEELTNLLCEMMEKKIILMNKGQSHYKDYDIASNKFQDKLEEILSKVIIINVTTDYPQGNKHE